MPFWDWKEFKLKLLKRFEASRNLTPSERLFALKQDGSVDEFIEDFEDLSAHVDNLDDESLESIFKNGLKPELKALIRMLKPKGLPEMISTALEMEANIISRMVGRAFVQEISGHTSYSQHRSQGIVGWNGRATGGGLNSNGNKKWNKHQSSANSLHQRPKLKLSPTEYEEEKKEGIFFKCDEKYFMGNECTNKELRVMLVINGCEIELDEDGEESVKDDEVEEEHKELLELSLNSF